MNVSDSRYDRRRYRYPARSQPWKRGLCFFVLFLLILSVCTAGAQALESPPLSTGTEKMGVKDTSAYGGSPLGDPGFYIGLLEGLPIPVHEIIGRFFSVLFFAGGIDEPTMSLKWITKTIVPPEDREWEGSGSVQNSGVNPVTPAITPLSVDIHQSGPAETGESPDNGPIIHPSATPQPAPSLTYGGVYVDSFPSGIFIILDGKTLTSTTPKLIFGLSEGLHSIRIPDDKKIFSVYEQKVWIYKGIVNIARFEVNPELKTKKITIQSDLYPGAQFTVNGKYPANKIPSTITLREYGNFLTILDNESYVVKEIPDTLDPGGTMSIRFSETGYGNVSVTSHPEGADVLMDGFVTGLKTPCIIRNVSMGRHLILVSKLGYIPSEHPILVMENPREEADCEVTISLEPTTYGEVAITSTPEKATVVIDKLNFRRTTPCIFEYMSPGSYSVKVTHQGTTRIMDFQVGPQTRQTFEFNFNNNTITKYESILPK